MRKIHLLLSFLFVYTAVNAQQRGFKPIKVDGTGSEVLYNQSHALVIGMNNYTAGWPKLPGVTKDIPAVKTALENNGFHVIVKENLSRTELDAAFMDFITKFGQGPENRLVVYFAGHGHTLNNFGETIGYIVPVDAPNPNYNEAGFIAKAMPMARIEEYAKQSKSKHILFLFDACFSGSLFAVSRAVPEAISYKTAKPVRQFITSGSADETVPDKSIFREQFVIALSTDYADTNKDGYLTGTELGTFLQDNVINYSRNAQHPQYGKIRNPYLDKGDFVFVLSGSTDANNETDYTEPETGGLVSGEVVYTYGNISIDTEIGGKLYLDGKFMGNLQANTKGNTLQKQLTGDHTIKIEGVENFEKSIIVYANQTVYITVQSKNLRDLRDGNTYRIVKIGKQIWIAENLAYKAGSGCWAYDNDESNVMTYGYLYNWETAKNVCPQGWHLPSDEEWTDLTNYIYNSGNNIIDVIAAEDGFYALHGGAFYGKEGFSNNQKYGSFWSSSPFGNKAWIRSYHKEGKWFSRQLDDKEIGNSVRCLKD